jgi:hypothetical protein
VAYSQLVFARDVDKHGGKTQPEKRLLPMSTSFCMCPGDNRAINLFVMHSAWFHHVSDWVSFGPGACPVNPASLLIFYDWSP